MVDQISRPFLLLTGRWVTPPTPTLVDVNSDGKAGDWLIGATPRRHNPAKPVLVFVQGLQNSAEDWWGPTFYYGDNDMYAYAYNNGYRTAFVQLADADGPAASMWVNGEILSRQLKAATEHYGVDQVDIVAHSKGGIDSQTAIVYYGGSRYVRRLITLSTPNYGSPLADLAFSWYGWRLAALVGTLDAGTFVLQIGYMDLYRQITDPAPENASVDYCTSGGTNWGPQFSALWFGGLYLSAWGANDGLVNVWSSRLPYGYNIFTADLNHDNIRTGSGSWNRFAPYLRPVPARASFGASVAATATPSVDETARARRFLVRGGAFRGSTRLNFAVESGLPKLEAMLLMRSRDGEATLISPSGERVALTASVATLARGIPFADAHVLHAAVGNPPGGEWTLSISSKARDDAYLAHLAFNGGVGLTLKMPAAVVSPGDTLPIAITSDRPVDYLGAEGMAVSIVPVDGVSPGNRPPDHAVEERFRVALTAGAANTWVGTLRMPDRECIYNVTIDVRGTVAGSSAFQRALIASIAVVKPRHRNPDGLKGLLDEK